VATVPPQAIAMMIVGTVSTKKRMSRHQQRTCRTSPCAMDRAGAARDAIG